ncbi:SDR family oxidoreductase [Pseudomonas sp. ALS1279]|nr:SDR family oxidoreductase [Pseudomonas sp. ALS1279]
MNRMKDKVAIITGAAQGIGATYAKALAAEGAKVVLCDLNIPNETAAAIRAEGGTALALACDVTDGGAVHTMVEAAVAEFGGVQVLVNNAALFATLELKPFEQTSSAEWDKIMAVNVRGSFECAKAVLPVMRKQGYGKIVNIASATAFKGASMLLAYVASKGAVIAMTRSIAREVGDAGIRCNCLAPGLTMSTNVQANAAWADDIVRNNIASRCIKREAVPDDLIGALLFLASTDSDFMSGQTVVVDGGSVTH